MREGEEVTVVDMNMIRAAREIADEFDRRLGSEITRAKRAGCKLVYKLEEEEQIGRGTIFVARIRIVPVGDEAKRKMKRHGAQAIEGRADYEDAEHAFDALKAAVDEAFTLAQDAGIY